MKAIIKWLGAGVAGYAAYAGWTWLRYGHVKHAKGEAADPLLDSFVPEYEVYDRHATHVDAPAAVVLGAAKDMELEDSRIIRSVFRMRELLLGSGKSPERPRGMYEGMQALGWGLGCAGRDRARDRVRRSHETVAVESGVPVRAGRCVRSICRAGLREDRLDASGRSGASRRYGVPHGDPRGSDRRGCPCEVPTLLGVAVAGDHPDPDRDAAGVARISESEVAAVRRRHRSGRTRAVHACGDDRGTASRCVAVVGANGVSACGLV
jgi:hypothetical protein